MTATELTMILSNYSDTEIRAGDDLYPVSSVAYNAANNSLELITFRPIQPVAGNDPTCLV